MENKFPKIPEMNPDEQQKLDETIRAANQAVADLPARISQTQRTAMEVLAEGDKSFATIEETDSDDPRVK